MSRKTYNQRLWALAQKLTALRGGTTAWYYTDATWCSLAHGASPENYFVLRLFELSEKKRHTYLTAGRSKKLDAALNGGATADEKNTLADKYRFDQFFQSAGMIRRGFLYAADTDETAFRRFLAERDTVLLKPVRATQGRDIRIIRTGAAAPAETAGTQGAPGATAAAGAANAAGIDGAHSAAGPACPADPAAAAAADDTGALHALYERCVREHTVLEEVIRQHPALSRMNAGCVNTLRVNAVRARDGRIVPVGAALKCGADGQVTDNFHSGGIAYPVGLTSGAVCGPGRDNTTLNSYVTQPGSHVPMINLEIPYFTESLKMVEDAMNLVPGLRYVGWDIAITPDGPELIEGNFGWPGGNIIQLDGIGKYQVIKQML